MYRLELTSSNNPEVGAFANVLIVCQDVLERLMRLVLLAVIGTNLLCAISRAARYCCCTCSKHHGQMPGSKVLCGLLESLPCFACMQADRFEPAFFTGLLYTTGSNNDHQCSGCIKAILSIACRFVLLWGMCIRVCGK